MTRHPESVFIREIRGCFLISRARPLREMGRNRELPPAAVSGLDWPRRHHRAKKSPSDGQGRVAHRRGSRFYTTILRVVKRLNTGFSQKFRDAEKCFLISTCTTDKGEIPRMYRLRPLRKLNVRMRRDSRESKSEICPGGESAWLRLQNCCYSAGNPMVVLHGTRMFIDWNANHQPGAASPWGHATRRLYSPGDDFRVELKAESP